MAVGEEDVLRLDVAVDEPLPVSEIQRRTDFRGDSHCFTDRQLGLPPQPIPERAVGHVRADVVQPAVGLAGIDERQDVRVGEPRRDADLAQEALRAERGRQGRVEDLDRDLAAVLAVLGEIHRRHPAAPDLAFDGVALGERRGELGRRGRHRYAAAVRMASTSGPGSYRTGSVAGSPVSAVARAIAARASRSLMSKVLRQIPIVRVGRTGAIARS